MLNQAPQYKLSESENEPRLRLIRSRSQPPSRARQELSEASLQLNDLSALLEEWYDWCGSSGLSKQTIGFRRVLFARLDWFLTSKRPSTEITTLALRRFFTHLINGHEDPAGRWGNVKSSQGRKPLSPATVGGYYAHFSAFFGYLVHEEYLHVNLMDGVPRPKVAESQIEILTPAEIQAFFGAARKSRYPRRDEAIVRLLLDTGVRASELVNLRLGNISVFESEARVVNGKGHKSRTVAWGQEAGKALRRYLREELELVSVADGAAAPNPDNFVFISEGGQGAGGKLTVSGLRQLIERLGEKGHVPTSKRHPHVFRHTFATMYMEMENGGDIDSLRQILGHTTYKATTIYMHAAKAQAKKRQKAFSPGDRIGRGE